MQQQINAYDQDSFRKLFEGTPLHQTLIRDFDELIYDRDCRVHCEITPRQQLGDPSSVPSRFFVSAFYYLQWLTSTGPDHIYDLGCGWNVFKRYLPNVIGVGAESPSSPYFAADIHDFVDADYVAGHQQTFQAVFSICALHFIPLSSLRQRVIDFASMIQPGGRGWLSLNAQRMLERDNDWQKTNGVDPRVVEHYVRSELSDLPFDLLVFDVFLCNEINNGINGNIHLVIEKPSTKFDLERGPDGKAADC